VAAVVVGDEAVAEEGRWTYPTAQVVVKEVVEEVTTAVATKVVEAEVTTAAVIEVVDVVALPHAAALAQKSSSEFH
jgi:hypothetical protein